MSTKLEAALELAARGFRVFPLDINSKLPAFEANWRKLASSDPTRIARMWTDPVFDVPLDYNIGIAPSPDMVVVDVDVRDGKQGDKQLATLEAIHDELPPTFTVISASGGEHRYFKTDKRDSGTFPKKLADDIDLKGDGGYVVGPGSTIDGKPYARAEGGASEIALAPGWLRDLPVSKRRDNNDRVGQTRLAPATELDTKDAIKRATEWLENDAPHSGTFKVAARVKDFGISEETCFELMIEHWPGADTREGDHISFRVQNAYRYGQSAPGIASPEAEFDAVEIPTNPIGVGPNPKRGLYAVRWHDAKPTLDRPYLIDDLMDLGVMVVTYGDSNVGKSYIVLDKARCIATGDDFNGHKVKQGLVVYVASEGGTGFHKRIEAYRREFKLDSIPFSLVPCPIDLHTAGDAGDTDRLIRLIRAEETHFELPCVLIVIDTLARAMGGGDENTSVDMGLLVRHCDRLRQATGATVNLIHHTGKDKAKGARGSSALRAATDTEIEVDSGVVSVQKQRDMARLDPMHFALKPVTIGARSDGRDVTACVVEWRGASEFEDKLSPEAQQMLDILHGLLAERQDKIEEEGGDVGAAKVPWAEWEAAMLRKMKGPRGKKITRQRIFLVRPELEEAGLSERDGQDRWSIPDKADRKA